MSHSQKVELKVTGMYGNVSPTAAAMLTLGEIDGTRQLSVIVGATEAQSIMVSLRGITPRRMLTHDLFASCLETLHVAMSRALIYKEDNGLFYSYIYLKVESVIIRIDARTSDAIAMALRMKAPIYATEEILDAHQIRPNHRQDEPKNTIGKSYDLPSDDFLKEDTLDVLQTLLHRAVEEENYEQAAYLRDEINARKQQAANGETPSEDSNE
ncbi:MAG: bifunctional nuclease family protein [Prevotellaceae bacterium]|jgi:bifunctional DNase/RNase|nr:bifunctional nuclease family protein [Prevotellaceae bacterium]